MQRHAAVVVLVLLVVALALFSLHGSIALDYLSKSRHGKVDLKPRYVFIDVGANQGDSVDTFLRESSAAFKYEFPTPKDKTVKDAELYLFEANPYFNEALVRKKQKLQKAGHVVHIFPSTVIGTSDVVMPFFLDKVNKAYSYWGSSVFRTASDVQKSNETKVQVTSINFARFLLSNFVPQDFVIVKMDIEGSEFEVVPHMVNMSAQVVVDHLFMETHAATELYGQQGGEMAAARLQDAVTQMKAEGVNVPSYESTTR